MTYIEKFVETARQNLKRIVFPESGNVRILRAVRYLKDHNIVHPVLIGDPPVVGAYAATQAIDISDIDVISVGDSGHLEKYADIYLAKRPLKKTIAMRLIKKPLSFGGMMVTAGDADGMVAGVGHTTTSVIQAAALTIGYRDGVDFPSSFFIMILPEFAGTSHHPLIFADCAVAVDPTDEQLAQIAVAAGENAAQLLKLEPKVALLSFSTHGSANHQMVDKIISATKIARQAAPGMKIDGELQGDAALIERVARKKVAGSEVAGAANVLVFPDLHSGNIAYKLVQYLAGAQAIGPVFQGFKRPVNDLSRGASIEDIVSVAAITAVQAAG